MAVASLLLAALLGSGPRAQLDAGLETSAHAGTDYPGPLGPAGSRTLDVVPSLGLLLEEPLWQVQARYAPRLVLANGGESTVLGTLQNGSLAARYRQSRTFEWVASERFRFGRSEVAWDPGARRPFDSLDGLLPLLPDEVFNASEVGFSMLPARGLTLDVSAGYLAYGGVSAASQRLVPLQQGPQLYAALGHELTRNDQISSELYAAYTFATGDRQSSLLKWTARWRRQLAAATRTSLALGTSVDRRWRPSDAQQLDVFPVGEAAFEHDLFHRTHKLELRAVAALEPRYSPITADIQERAELGVAARWILQERFSFRGRAAAARELQRGAAGAHVIVSAFDAALELRKDLSLTAGAEAIWQRVAPGTPVPASGWFAFAGLSFTTRNIL
jgi:hypothetical protein